MDDPPTSLVRDLHDYPRLDSNLESANSTLPDFVNDEYQKHYLQGVLNAAAFPVLLLMAYFLLELVVRLVMSFCKCCERRRPRAREGGTVVHAHLAKTRCWWITVVFLALCAGAALYSGIHYAKEAGDATAAIGDHGVEIGDRVQWIHGRLGDAAEDLNAVLKEAEVLQGTDTGPEVSGWLREIVTKGKAADFDVLTMRGIVHSVSVKKYVDGFHDHSDEVYGRWSGMTGLLAGVTTVTLAFVMFQAVATRESRGWLAHSCLLLADFVTVCLIVALCAVAFIQLSAAFIAADACVDPMGNTNRVLAAHLDGDTLETAQHYVNCGNPEFAANPLNRTLSSSLEELLQAEEYAGQVEAWANENGDREQKAAAASLVRGVRDAIGSYDVLEDGLHCDSVKLSYDGIFHVGCDPLVFNIFHLMILQASVALTLVFLRGVAVYRCCRCCYRAKEDSSAEWLLGDVSAGAGGGVPPGSAAPGPGPTPVPPGATYGTATQYDYGYGTGSSSAAH